LFRQARRFAVKHADDGSKKYKEKKFKKNLIKRNKDSAFEKNKFENYFSVDSLERQEFSLPLLSPLEKPLGKVRSSSKSELKSKINADMRSMIEEMEAKAKHTLHFKEEESEGKKQDDAKYQMDVIQGAKDILKNLINIDI
jgi:hypothetical protein